MILPTHYHLQPFIYLQYLDEICLIWQHSLEELHTFVDHHYRNYRNYRNSPWNTPVKNFHSWIQQSNSARGLCIMTCFANKLTHSATCCTAQPTSTNIRKVSLTANSYRSEGSVAIKLILTKMLDLLFLLPWKWLPCHLVKDSYIKFRRMDRNYLLDPPFKKEEHMITDDETTLVPFFTLMSRPCLS